VREVIQILVWSSVDLGEAEGEEDSYFRFIVSLTMNHRRLFLDALEDKWNTGYQRCLTHIRKLLPHVPPDILNQRLVLMGLYVGAVMTARESAFDRGGAGRAFWAAHATMSNFIDTVQALLESPVSKETQADIEKIGRSSRPAKLATRSMLEGVAGD
jgi:hypothetical protein